MIKKLYFVLLSGLIAAGVFAQKNKDTIKPVPIIRQVFHDQINATQKNILNSDGIEDDKFTPVQDSELNLRLTYFATEEIDDLQSSIEADTSLNNNNKIKYLRGLNEVLSGFLTGYRYRLIRPTLLPDLINAFKEAMQLEQNKKSLETLISNNVYEVGNLLMQSISFQDNAGADGCKNILFLKYCRRHPEKALSMLSKNPETPYADSIIIHAAYKYPDKLYDYAADPNTLGMKIRQVDDPLTKAISQMASTKNGRQYFPFLDDIYKGKMTFEQIDSVMDDSLKYFRLLVKTEIDYVDRMRQRDTPMAMQALTHKLVSTAELFVNTINGLHEAPDEIRFRSLNALTPQELYYLTVMEEDIIYTSSYVKGVYAKIFQKLKPPRGDSLLLSVRFDHFKKWIKMAANYNTLNDFLKRMNKENAELLMKAFVNDLDKTQSFEDAVDVADSYSSIYDKKVKDLKLNQVQDNLAIAKQNNNLRGERIYSILNTLFLSMNDSNHVDVSKELGISPVYYMPNKLMRDSLDRIIVQQFFYGDLDGKIYFNNFLSSIDTRNWKITSSPEWVTVSSTHGVKVIIYTNKPLDEKQGLDDKAQNNLQDYLYDNNIEPAMIIHRGHSYHLSSTLERLQPSAKLILLGSCGGYQSFNKVLETCPEAQIITSKQTGSGSVNQPMINTIMETLRLGKDLNWPEMWKTYSVKFKGNSLFEDYVPPYKNLGAVFLIAYNKLSEADD